ncbi:MAG: hypothetical protein ACJA1W_004394 [Akkermansiaceae bacterium]|jgi:hypothetical protein
MTTGGAAAKSSPAPNWEIMMNRLLLGFLTIFHIKHRRHKPRGSLGEMAGKIWALWDLKPDVP